MLKDHSLSSLGLGSWAYLITPEPWYGLGKGVLLGCLLSALVGLVESAPAGIPLSGTDAYFYVVSPLAWILLSLLVVSHRLLGQGDARERGL